MNQRLQHLSHSFRTDADHLLEIGRVAYKHSPLKQRSPFQAKIVVQAYMSVECSLKSLMCSRNVNQKAEDVYREIIDCGHDLKLLLKTINSTFLTSEQKAFLTSASMYGVRLRYNVDFFSLCTNDLLVSDPGKLLIDDKYVTRFLAIADTVCKHAQNVHLASFGSRVSPTTSRTLKGLVNDLQRLRPKKRK